MSAAGSRASRRVASRRARARRVAIARIPRVALTEFQSLGAGRRGPVETVGSCSSRTATSCLLDLRIGPVP